MRRRMVCLAALLALLGGCADASPAPDAATGVQRLRVDVLGTLPHDRGAFTEGLEFDGGTLYESTGLAGESSLRAGPPGAAPARRVDLPAPLFGEGVTVHGPRLWQLTWQDGVAIRRDSATLAEQQRVGFDGEGWGLCDQPERGRLVMSNGSDRLTFRDQDSFAITGGVTVHDGARTYDQINELECVGDVVYANVWQTDTILRIDPGTGAVTGVADATGLLPADQRAGADVLNGIAAIPGTDQFLLTGKLWPSMFTVRLVAEQ